MTPHSHQQALELAALASVGAIDDEDRLDLDEHLDLCGPCRREAALLDDAAGLLPLLLAPVAPPGDLKSRLFERVRDFPPLLQQRRLSAV